MPIYEFHCEECGKDSEILVRSSDWKGTRCPQCKSMKLAKKFSTFASNAGSGEGACETGKSNSKSKSGGCCACASGRPHKH